jgi:hypothetical protein
LINNFSRGRGLSFFSTEKLIDPLSACGWQPKFNRMDGNTVEFKKRLDKEEKMKNKEDDN